MLVLAGDVQDTRLAATQPVPQERQMRNTHRAILTKLAATAGVIPLLAGCGGSDDGSATAAEKVVLDLIAAEQAADGSAAAALLTDDGIAAFYEGATRESLEAGTFEGFGAEPTKLDRIVKSSVDGAQASVVAAVIFPGPPGAQPVFEHLMKVDLVKDEDRWLADGVGLASAQPDPGKPIVTANAKDYGYDLTGEVGSADVVLKLTNSGEEPHEWAMVGLPADVSSADAAAELLAMDPAAPSPGYAMMDFAGFLEPGADPLVVKLVRPLPAGRYAFVCFIPTGGKEDGEPHLSKGMFSEFTVS